MKLNDFLWVIKINPVVLMMNLQDTEGHSVNAFVMAITSSNRKISFLCSFLPHLERMSQTVRVIASTQPSNEKEGHIEIVHIRVTDTELCIPLPCNTERKTFTSSQERDCIVFFFYFILFLFCSRHRKTFTHLYTFPNIFFFLSEPLKSIQHFTNSLKHLALGP